MYALIFFDYSSRICELASIYAVIHVALLHSEFRTVRVAPPLCVRAMAELSRKYVFCQLGFRLVRM